MRNTSDLNTSAPATRVLWVSEMPTESGTRFARIMAPLERDLVKPVPRECWWNALRGARRLTSKKHAHLLDGQPVLYVEGVCVMRTYGVPFEHGWLRIGDEIVETTADSLHQGYYAVRELTLEDAEAAYKRTRRRMPLMGAPQARHEVGAALQKAYTLALTQTFTQVLSNTSADMIANATTKTEPTT